jgi:hypothetical protein
LEWLRSNLWCEEVSEGLTAAASRVWLETTGLAVASGEGAATGLAVAVLASTRVAKSWEIDFVVFMVA